jgi:hypothetical protein
MSWKYCCAIENSVEIGRGSSRPLRCRCELLPKRQQKTWSPMVHDTKTGARCADKAFDFGQLSRGRKGRPGFQMSTLTYKRGVLEKAQTRLGRETSVRHPRTIGSGRLRLEVVTNAPESVVYMSTIYRSRTVMTKISKPCNGRKAPNTVGKPLGNGSS